jgi:hypothetical protein
MPSHTSAYDPPTWGLWWSCDRHTKVFRGLRWAVPIFYCRKLINGISGGFSGRWVLVVVEAIVWLGLNPPQIIQFYIVQSIYDKIWPSIKQIAIEFLFQWRMEALGGLSNILKIPNNSFREMGRNWNKQNFHFRLI